MMKGFHSFTQAGIAPSSQWWKTSIQVRAHPTHNDERFPHFHPGWNRIWFTMMGDFYPGGNTSYSQWWKISILSSRLELHPAHNDRIFLHLHPSRREHILLTVMKYFHKFIKAGIASCSQWWKSFALTSDLVGTKSYTFIKRACTHI